MVSVVRGTIINIFFFNWPRLYLARVILISHAQLLSTCPKPVWPWKSELNGLAVPANTLLVKRGAQALLERRTVQDYLHWSLCRLSGLTPWHLLTAVWCFPKQIIWAQEEGSSSLRSSADEQMQLHGKTVMSLELEVRWSSPKSAHFSDLSCMCLRK